MMMISPNQLFFTSPQSSSLCRFLQYNMDVGLDIDLSNKTNTYLFKARNEYQGSDNARIIPGLIPSHKPVTVPKHMKIKER